MNLACQLFADMRQAGIAGYGWVGCIAAQNNFMNAKTFGGTENRAHVMGGADIMQ